MKSLLIKAKLLVGIFAISYQLTAQTIIYVDVDATGSDNGTSWSHAYNDLQDALTYASSNSPAQIWVAEGTYTPGSSSSDSYTMLPDVEIYGGFVGTETSLTQRDFRSNTTILSGNLGAQQAEHIINNTYSIGIRLNNSAVLDGFHIRDGLSSSNYGAAIYNEYASPIIRNCNFYNNTAYYGGAVYNYYSSSTYLNCRFYDNTASSAGGAVYNIGDSNTSHIVTYTNCAFYRNSVRIPSGNNNGYGMALFSGSGVICKIYNSNFYDNDCISCNSGLGVLYTVGVALELINSIIYDNNGINSIKDFSGFASVGNCIIEGGFATGSDILASDPLWSDPANGDFSLDFCSPGVDFGVSGVLFGISEDLLGNTRIVGTDPDLGAVEYQDGVSFTTVAESCANKPDGQIIIHTTGNNSFQYSIDNGETYTYGNVFNNLSSGNYDILIKEVSTGCVKTFSTLVTTTAPITIINTVTDASCKDNTDGEISVSVTASNPPVTYSLDGTTYQSGNVFTNLSAGDYTVYVKDNNGCIRTATEEIGPDESYTVDVSHVTCTGSSDGQIQISVDGADSPYTFTFESDPPTPVGDFQNLSPGTYNIVVETGTGCIWNTISVTVSETVDWVGTTSDWQTTSNWCNNALPGNKAKVTIPTSASTMPVISGEVRLSDLNMETSTMLTVESGGALLLTGDFTGQGEVNAQRNLRGSGSYNLMGTPLAGVLTSDLQATHIFEWDGSSFTVPSGALQPGKGYFVATGGSNPTLDITGKPVTGQVNIVISNSGDAYNAVANPYLAAIDRSAFIAANSTAIDGNIWLWNDGGSNVGGSRGGDYVLINNLGVSSTVDLGDGVSGTKSLPSNNSPITSFQGFLVSATANASISFTPSMQVSTTGSNADGNFYRVDNESVSTLKLSLSNENHYNETLIGFTKEATDGLDYALDGAYRSVNPDFAFYSLSGETPLAIQGLPLANQVEVEVKLGFELRSSGTYHLQVEKMQNITGSAFLLDKKTNSLTLLDGSTSLEIELSPGKNLDQYSILFSPYEVLSSVRMKDKILIYGSTQKLHLTTSLQGNHQVTIHDLSGKVIHHEQVKFDNGHAGFPISLHQNQIYVLRVDQSSLKFIVK
ncbi:MAG: hypothetical protein CMB80_21660 [Flammeovirgaceae bacterium]|nr:hypothetical protein [Flammeovirgaceae bacterium]MBE62674.1 hypothetical protein [Flammeovirgaceae bacterium]